MKYLSLLTLLVVANANLICHIPPGNIENFQTINVSDNSKHLDHGDYNGSCTEICDILCTSKHCNETHCLPSSSNKLTPSMMILAALLNIYNN